MIVNDPLENFLRGVVRDCIDGAVYDSDGNRYVPVAEEWETCVARDEPDRNRCAACLDGEPERCEDVENARAR